MGKIKEAVKTILKEIPDNVEIVAAAKSRTAEEILEAIEAGIRIIGENYIQESQPIIEKIGDRAIWHFIGHLQKNKVKYVVPIYHMIETVDSRPLAEQISKHALKHGKVMPVLIEINSAREPQKFGVFPEKALDLIKGIKDLPGLKVMGLMTMGPAVELPDHLKPFFEETKALFDAIRNECIEGVEMKYLSMGMSDSYRVAIEAGANVIRIGTKIFGPRPQQ